MPSGLERFPGSLAQRGVDEWGSENVSQRGEAVTRIFQCVTIAAVGVLRTMVSVFGYLVFFFFLHVLYIKIKFKAIPVAVVRVSLIIKLDLLAVQTQTAAFACPIQPKQSPNTNPIKFRLLMSLIMKENSPRSEVNSKARCWLVSSDIKWLKP